MAEKKARTMEIELKKLLSETNLELQKTKIDIEKEIRRAEKMEEGKKMAEKKARTMEIELKKLLSEKEQELKTAHLNKEQMRIELEKELERIKLAKEKVERRAEYEEKTAEEKNRDEETKSDGKIKKEQKEKIERKIEDINLFLQLRLFFSFFISLESELQSEGSRNLNEEAKPEKTKVDDFLKSMELKNLHVCRRLVDRLLEEVQNYQREMAENADTVFLVALDDNGVDKKCNEQNLKNLKETIETEINIKTETPTKIFY
ncbi:hypothetical protein MHBO_001664 [Bonamia ostreae]|uniref:Uncharacterized protein n=1 Tax=Bonamia ostreae TaxID=126728 RepID=A0ABV2AJQ8_9EUKA